MNIEEGIKKMREAQNKLKTERFYDEENLHIEIDEIIREFLPPEIKAEYDRLRKEESFWFS